MTEEIARTIQVLLNKVTNLWPIEQLGLSTCKVTEATDNEHEVQSAMEISYDPNYHSDAVKLLFNQRARKP